MTVLLAEKVIYFCILIWAVLAKPLDKSSNTSVVAAHTAEKIPGAKSSRLMAVTSWGNVDIPSGASVYNDSRIALYFAVNSSDLIVLAKYSRYQYFAILLSGSMSNGDYHVFQTTSAVTKMQDCHGGIGHTPPSADTSDNLQLIGYDTDRSTYITLKYSRPLNTGDSEDTPLTLGQSFTFSYAYRSGSAVLAMHLSNQHVSFSGALGSSTTTSSSSTGTDPVLVHGIVLTVFWTIAIDIGLWTLAVYKFKHRINIHALLSDATAIATIVEVSMFIQRFRDAGSYTADSRQQAHYVIGILILAWVIFQTITGIASKMILEKDAANPRTIEVLRKVHKLSGIVLLTLGKANVLLGWILYDKTVGLILVILEIVLNYAIRLYIIFVLRRPLTSSPEHNKIKPDVELSKLLAKPYNDPEVQKQNIYIFDDKVYKLQEIDEFHPGGKMISLISNGRQIDRFMYGSYHLEIFPELQRFVHPKPSMDLIGDPVATLTPNLMYEISATRFKPNMVLKVAHQIQLYLFSGINGETIFRQTKNTTHIGQYFVVEGFGLARLYTCVACMRKEAREHRTQALTKHGLPNTYGDWLTVFKGQQHMFYQADSTQRMTKRPDDSVPLLIKTYSPLTAFTSKLSLTTPENVQIVIRGLRGRGLCLNTIPRGNVVLFAGGTGLYPFLDLIEIIFEEAMCQTDASLSANENLLTAAMELKGLKFTLFGAFESSDDLGMGSELLFLERKAMPNWRSHLKLKSDKLGFKQTLSPEIKFNTQLLRQHPDLFGSSSNLSMVYICGPPLMYKSVIQGLKEIGVPDSKVFLV